MLYETIIVNDKEYKLRLNARSCVDLEKRLGTNPLNVLMKAQEGEIPSLEDLLTILHASLQAYHHGISMDDVYDMYDKFVDEGKLLTDLLPIIINIFKVSGFFKEEKNNSKNSTKASKK